MVKARKPTGFTLIELLVVIAIIALLMAILIPGMKLAKDLTKRVVCAARLRQVGLAMSSYSQSYDILPDAVDNTGKIETGHGYALYRADKPEWFDADGDPIPLRWAKLYEGGYMDVPEIFYCTGNRMDIYKYDSYTNPAPWGSLPQQYNTMDAEGYSHNQWVRMGYTYFPVPSGSPEWNGDRLVLAEKFVHLSHTMPYATDILHGRSNLSHQRSQDPDKDTFDASNKYSVNALYSDTHVSNCNDPDVFSSQIWDDFSDEKVTYDEYYYAVFKLIGSR